jgi:hypothetical protein
MRQTTRMFLVALSTVAAVGGCDALDETIAALTAQITEAVSAEEQALVDDTTDPADGAADDRAADDGTADDGTADDGEGRGGHRHAAPGAAPDSFGDVEVPVCAPPVAADVELGHRQHGRAHLAAIYDNDESGDLDDTELAALQADAALGCELKNASLLADFDVDGDGALAQAEYDAARDARREARDAARAAADTDGDGEVSRDEHEAAEAAVISSWDVDVSGDLDETERAAMRADLQALVRAGADLPPLPGRGARHEHGRRGHGRHDEDRQIDDDGATDAADDTAGGA